MLKVLYIADSLNPTWGAYKAIVSLLENIVPKGVQALAITSTFDSQQHIFNNANIKTQRILYYSSIYPRCSTIKDKLLFIPRLLRKLLINNIATIKLLIITKKYKPDIIHTNVSLTAIGYYVARILKIPHIWHIREYGAIDFNTSYYYPSFSIQKKRYKSKFSYTIGITKDILKYNKLQNHPNSKIIYDGVLPSHIQSYNPNKKPYFLYAGRLEKIKGILPLIDAYAEYCTLHLSPLTLYVAGCGSEAYTQLVKEKIATCGLENNIKLLGVRNDILELYKDAKAFIVPSLSEGFGFITAEAMFSGCLVIGNNTAGTKEQFDNGKEITGEEIALRYTTQEQLVQHLIDVTNNNTDYYEPMILRAQQVVTQLYSTESHAENVYNFYKEILANQ